MRAEILATGNEITTGAVIDSNSAYIAEALEESGVTVFRHSCVADDMDSLVDIFKEVGNRAEIVVVTGGLGPTSDDLTTEAAAKAAGLKLSIDAAAKESMENYFKARKIKMPESNNKQAMLPEGAECLINPVGTAPGFLLKMGHSSLFFLPGVPHEMRKMLQDEVLPRVAALQEDNRIYRLTKTISTFGLPESKVNEHLDGFSRVFSEIKIGLRAVFPVIQVKFYANGKNECELKDQLENAFDWVKGRLNPWIFSVSGNRMEDEVGKLLYKKKSNTIHC